MPLIQRVGRHLVIIPRGSSNSSKKVNGNIPSAPGRKARALLPFLPTLQPKRSGFSPGCTLRLYWEHGWGWHSTDPCAHYFPLPKNGYRTPGHWLGSFQTFSLVYGNPKTEHTRGWAAAVITPPTRRSTGGRASRRARPAAGTAPGTAPCRRGLRAGGTGRDTTAAGNAATAFHVEESRVPVRSGAASRYPSTPGGAPAPAAPGALPCRCSPCRRGAARGRRAALSRAIPRSRGRTTPPPQPWSPPPAEPECARRAPLPVFSPAGEEEGGVRVGWGRAGAGAPTAGGRH